MKIQIPLVALGLVSSAAAALATEYGTVISTTPVVVQAWAQQQQCTEQQALVQSRTSGGGQVLGAIIGGVIGNSLGGGAGRAAATGLGVVAGSIIGNQAEAANTPPTVVPLRNCQNSMRLENRVLGYDVVYEYNGQRYSARMAQPPTERVALTMTVVGAVSPEAPAVEAAPAPPPMVEAPPPAVVAYPQPYGYGAYGAYGAYGGYGGYGPSLAIVPNIVIGGAWRWRRGYGH